MMRSKADETTKTNLENETLETGKLNIELPDIDGNTIFSFPHEVVDNLRSLIIRLSIENPFPKKLALTSALRSEGVTYQVHALAATLANDSSANVGLVALNWWWPATLPYHPTAENGGLTAVINGELKLDDIIIPSGWSNLSFIPAGNLKILDRPRVARSNRLKGIIDSLSHRFDHIILDVPAVLASSDSPPLLGLADGCCLVIRQGATHTNDVKIALDTIQHLNIYGVILNMAKLKIPKPLLGLVSQA